MNKNNNIVEPANRIKFFDNVSKIILSKNSDLFFAYEFTTKLEKHLRHINNVKAMNKNKFILYA